MFVLTHVNSYLDQDHHRFLEPNNVWSKQLTTPNMRDWWLNEQRQIIHGNVILFKINLTYFLPSLEQANAPSKLYQSRLWILVKDGHCNKERLCERKPQLSNLEARVVAGYPVTVCGRRMGRRPLPIWRGDREMRGGGPAPERIWGAWAGERTWEMIRVCCAEEKKHLGGLSLSWGRRRDFKNHGKSGERSPADCNIG